MSNSGKYNVSDYSFVRKNFTINHPNKSEAARKKLSDIQKIVASRPELKEKQILSHQKYCSIHRDEMVEKARKMRECAKRDWENYYRKFRKSVSTPEHKKILSDAAKGVWGREGYRSKQVESHKNFFKNGGKSFPVGETSKGTHWYNDGVKNIRSKLKECPQGFKPGRIQRFKWYNNGVENTM